MANYDLGIAVGGTNQQIADAIKGVADAVSNGMSAADISAALQGGGASKATITKPDNIIFAGASNIGFMMANFSTLSPQMLSDFGLDDVNFYEAHINGSADYSAVADLVLSTYPSLIGVTHVVWHGNGNYVSNTLPWDGAQVDNSVATGFDKIIAAGYENVFMGCSWRNYANVITEGEYLGADPYNQNIYYPLIREYSPAWWDNENKRPYIDIFSYSKLNLGSMQDTVHQKGSGMLGFVLNRLGTMYNADDNYDISGKNIICGVGTSLSAIEFTTPKIGSMFDGVSSFLRDSAGKISSVTASIIPYGTANTAGRGSSDTSYSILNDCLLKNAYYTTSTTTRTVYVRTNDKRNAGHGFKLRVTGSRASSSIVGISDITCQGVTLAHNGTADPAVYVEFTGVLDIFGNCEFTITRQAESTYSYFSGFQIIFD
jgi:hypothetical protein